jgi:transposase-like protein
LRSSCFVAVDFCHFIGFNLQMKLVLKTLSTIESTNSRLITRRIIILKKFLEQSQLAPMTLKNIKMGAIKMQAPAKK